MERINMHRRLLSILHCCCWAFFILASWCSGQEAPRYAGIDKDGVVLLPNGWRLTPAGEQVALTDLPLNILVTPDNRYALVATSGYNAHELVVVDLQTKQRVASAEVKESWFGLGTDPNRNKLWWSGGGGSEIHHFERQDGKLIVAASSTNKPATQTKSTDDKKPSDPARQNADGFKTGLFVDHAKSQLYSLTIFARGGNKSLDWGQAVTLDNSG